MTQERDCPAMEYKYVRGPDTGGSNFLRLDEFQRQARPFFRAKDERDYWVFTDHDVILEALQDPELFSSAAAVPLEPDPLYT
jgi:cytochrome P450